MGISPCRAHTRGAATPCVVASLIVGHNTAALLPGAGPWGGPLPECWISRVNRGLKPGQVDTAQPVDGSGSHGWCGVALLWLHDSVLGVSVASPGGARVSVAPQRSGLAYVCGATNTPKVRRHADVRHTLVLGLLGHGSLCVCVTHWVGVRMCGCSVSGWGGCVRMAVRAAVTHIAGHCGTKCLACCHCPH